MSQSSSVTKPEEIIENLRTIKLNFALSPNTDVMILFNGESPDADCFRRLHQLIDLTKDAMLSDGEKNNKLKPCEKHPEAYRNPVTKRCVECMKELADRMNQKRRQRRKPNGSEATNV